MKGCIWHPREHSHIQGSPRQWPEAQPRKDHPSSLEDSQWMDQPGALTPEGVRGLIPEERLEWRESVVKSLDRSEH